jgi:hypothetical protein
MSVVQSPTANLALNPRRAYITTSAYNSDLYTYTVTTNPTTFVRTGTLAANVVGATASTCPANRILRENGKRLYPDANPQISTLLVGVYDAVSGLNGFIDPNSPKFAVFNSDKANFLPNGIDPNGGLTDQGAPVFTRGTITSGAIAATGAVTATTTVTGGTGLIATAGQIRAATGTALTTITGTANMDINPALGQVFTVTLNASSGTVTVRAVDGAGSVAAPAVGSVVYLIITTAAGHTTATVQGSANVKMVSITANTASRTHGLVFVSDGTNLVQVGGDIAAAAMS